MKNKIEKFSPLAFLSSLGAGGLAVAFFALINYSLPHGKGLITYAQTHELLTGAWLAVYSFLEIGMALFILLHLFLTVYLLRILLAWFKAGKYQEFIKSPLSHSGIMAPLISLTMTMNVFIGAVRYFTPWMSNNFQSIMLPGLLTWLLLWSLTMYMALKLMKIAFTKGFDVNQVNFGWLLQPMTLGMVTVTGAGIVALSADKTIADIAAFFLLVSGSMGLFLLLVKMTAIFKSHFQNEGLPEKQFLPSLLIVVPNITIYAIAFFRFGHYLEHHYNAHLGNYFMVLMTAAFAFETWYLLFGITLLKDYFSKHVRREFHVSQWGLICPFVAYSVLGAFVYNLFLPYTPFLLFIIGVITFTVALYVFLLSKQFSCARSTSMKKGKNMQAKYICS